MSDVANSMKKSLNIKPSRREVAAVGAVAALWSGNAGAAVLQAAAAPVGAGPLPVKVEGNLFRPESGEHPGLVMFSHAAASDAANAAVAQQLAAQGWSVMLVDTQSRSDHRKILAEAGMHVEQLLTKSGVAAPGKAAKNAAAGKKGYQLHAVSAAYPGLSLASRDERREAALSSVLFSVPTALVAKDEKRMESLRSAVRALHKRAA